MIPAPPSANPQPATVTGFLGGSFDPIHHGHVALAHAAVEQLQLDTLHIIPAGQPWQRAPLQASPEHRLAMAQCAFVGEARITVDDREITRSGATYTYDTLCALRQEFGPSAVLVWIIGSDQLHHLPHWHRSQDLFALAHFAVAQRAGDSPLAVPASLKSLLTTDTMHWRQHPAGCLIQFTMPPVAISATQLRAMLKQRPPTSALTSMPAATLAPAAVLHYIEQHSLYR